MASDGCITVNDESEMMRNEVRETTWTLSHQIWYPGRDSNRASPEYEWSFIACGQPARCKKLQTKKINTGITAPEHWMYGKELRMHMLNEASNKPCLHFCYLPVCLYRKTHFWLRTTLASVSPVCVNQREQHSQRQQRITCTLPGVCNVHADTASDLSHAESSSPPKKKLPCALISNFPMRKAPGKVNALWRVQWSCRIHRVYS
jgi:hypothetical protein